MKRLMNACAAAALLGLTANVAAAEPLRLDARQLDFVTARGIENDRSGLLANVFYIGSLFSNTLVQPEERDLPSERAPNFIFDIGDVTLNRIRRGLSSIF